MFKTIGNFLHRTPWWALFLLGLALLIALGLFTTPFHVIGLQKSGETPEQTRAIRREVDATLGQSALGIAENVVEAIRRNSKDPARKEELDRALQEIAQARSDMEAALGDVRSAQHHSETIRDAAQEARQAAQIAAYEAARDAAQTAYEEAVAAREAVEETQRKIRRSLKEAGVPESELPKSLVESLRAANRTEEKASRNLEKASRNLEKVRARVTERNTEFTLYPEKKNPLIHIEIGERDRSGSNKQTLDKESMPSSLPPLPPASPSLPLSGLKIDIPSGPEIALPPLPPEMRDDIRSKVRSDVYRIGIGSVAIVLFIPLFMMAVIAKFFIDRSRAAQRLAEVKKSEAEFHNINRQITEAKLQALQAQVEPHFLYNTLANVQALTEVEPAAAHKMVGHLIQYLRAALPKMRENTSTVGQEIELVRAYLNILKMRMGERLEFDIDVPSDLQALAFPPLMLPSLVENAIKHGLEPQRLGGHIQITAKTEGGKLFLTVQDTGRGFSEQDTIAGGGVGLANIRERLTALYGDAAKLTLEENRPQGVVATIEIPTQGTASSAGPASPAAHTAPVAAPSAGNGSKIWAAVSKTHSLWSRFLSSAFMVLLIALAVAFGIALAAMYAGWLPVHVGGARLEGIEGLAIGSLGLMLGFGVMAIVLMIVIAVIYGLGVLFAGLLIFIPVVILIASFPALAPFILFGLIIYWYLRRRKIKN